MKCIPFVYTLSKSNQHLSSYTYIVKPSNTLKMQHNNMLASSNMRLTFSYMQCKTHKMFENYIPQTTETSFDHQRTFSVVCEGFDSFFTFAMLLWVVLLFLPRLEEDGASVLQGRSNVEADPDLDFKISISFLSSKISSFFWIDSDLISVIFARNCSFVKCSSSALFTSIWTFSFAFSASTHLLLNCSVKLFSICLYWFQIKFFSDKRTEISEFFSNL